MGWRPQLNVYCSRCNQAHGPFGVCVNPRNRKQTYKPKLSFGKCPKCRKRYGAGGPLTHACVPRSDFKRRRKQFEKEERERARKARPKHDYTECSDAECKRSLCVAYKGGIALGDERGFERGWDQGYDRGVADCPRDHK
jgi:hypothetical protein